MLLALISYSPSEWGASTPVKKTPRVRLSDDPRRPFARKCLKCAMAELTKRQRKRERKRRRMRFEKSPLPPASPRPRSPRPHSRQRKSGSSPARQLARPQLEPEHELCRSLSRSGRQRFQHLR